MSNTTKVKLSEKQKEVIGKTFNFLTVVGRVVDKTGKGRIWKCSCCCGKIIFLTSQKIFNGGNKSCGCKKKELTSKANKTHGLKGRPEYNIWCGMKRRCLSKTCQQYGRYGAIGIKVCERWLSFENFISDMGFRPSLKHSLDRYPNKNGNYEPGNCRWATPSEQCNNRKNNLFLTYKNQTKSMSQWAHEYKIHSCSIQQRLAKGMTISQILSKKVLEKIKSKTTVASLKLPRI